jgi:hypothetical protein
MQRGPAMFQNRHATREAGLLRPRVASSSPGGTGDPNRRNAMPVKSVRAAVLLAALSTALPAAGAAPAKAPACNEGEVSVRGACVTACPSSGTFADPDRCECQPGFSKILHGSGGGECQPVRCTMPGADAKLCTCPNGYQKKAKKAGKAVCVAPKAPKAKAKPTT